jgi:hypothetical protein
MNDLRNLLEANTITERKSFIKSFVKEIVITGENVLMKYTIPATTGGLTKEGQGVPHIVHYGGEGGTRTPKPFGT